MTVRVRPRCLVPLTFVAVVASCDAARETPPERPAETSLSWHELGTWSGRGSVQTESFDVTTGALRLAWTTSTESAPGAGRLRVSLYSSISGRPLQTIVDVQGVGADTVRFGDEPRVTYLQIESADVDWLLTLEEATGSRVEAPARE